MLEHVHSVIIQVSVLLPREVAHAHTRVDSPRIQKLVSDLRDDDQFLPVGERDVALVEEVIDVRRQQQASARGLFRTIAAMTATCSENARGRTGKNFSQSPYYVWRAVRII